MASAVARSSLQCKFTPKAAPSKCLLSTPVLSSKYAVKYHRGINRSGTAVAAMGGGYSCGCLSVLTCCPTLDRSIDHDLPCSSRLQDLEGTRKASRARMSLKSEFDRRCLCLDIPAPPPGAHLYQPAPNLGRLYTSLRATQCHLLLNFYADIGPVRESAKGRARSR